MTIFQYFSRSIFNKEYNCCLLSFWLIQGLTQETKIQVIYSSITWLYLLLVRGKYEIQTYSIHVKLKATIQLFLFAMLHGIINRSPMMLGVLLLYIIFDVLHSYAVVVSEYKSSVIFIVSNRINLYNNKSMWIWNISDMNDRKLLNSSTII